MCNFYGTGIVKIKKIYLISHFEKMKISNYDRLCRPLLTFIFNSLDSKDSYRNTNFSSFQTLLKLTVLLCFQDISDLVNNVKVCTDSSASAEHWIKNISIFTAINISDYG